MTTSAQRDESRLTPNDRQAMRLRVRELIDSGESYTPELVLAEAVRAIGLHTVSLRDSELAEAQRIAAEMHPIYSRSERGWRRSGEDTIHVLERGDRSRAVDSDREFDSRCGFCYLRAPHSLDLHRHRIQEAPSG